VNPTLRKYVPDRMRFAVRYPLKTVRRFGIGHLASAARQLMPHGGVVAYHPPCVQHSLHLRAGTSDSLVFEQIYLSEEYDFDYEPDPKLIIDAGANIGLASIYFANRFPGATVISIEPELDNYQMLCRNVAPYRPRIRPLRGGLWGKHADLEVRDIGLGEWAFMVEEMSQPTVSSFPAFTVDEILDNSGFDRVDILKVDIEGAEKEVFEGDVERWLGRVGLLILELHDRFKPGCEEAVSSGIAGHPHTSHWNGENVYYAFGH
jgi:FkbM family methyltransferase